MQTYSDMDYWLTTGREELYRSVEKTSTQNEGVAKNILLFVGGGMGVSTVTASRIYKAQGGLVAVKIGFDQEEKFIVEMILVNRCRGKND